MIRKVSQFKAIKKLKCKIWKTILISFLQIFYIYFWLDYSLNYYITTGFASNQPEIPVPRTSSIKNLEELVVSLYPQMPLQLVGFNFGRFQKGGAYLKVKLLHPETLQDLIRKVKKSKLLIVPLRRLPMVNIQEFVFQKCCRNINKEFCSYYSSQESNLPSYNPHMTQAVNALSSGG